MSRSRSTNSHASRASSGLLFRGGRRDTKGSITEFGVAVIVFFCFLFIPLVNLSFITVKYLVAHATLTKFTERLAKCDSFSAAREEASRLAQDGSDTYERQILEAWGIKITAVGIADLDESEQAPLDPKILRLRTSIEMLPPYGGEDGGVPGITGPWPMSVVSEAMWEHYGEDVVTQKKFTQ